MSVFQLIEKEEFSHVFQPIFETKTWGKIGYEAFLRTPFAANPEMAFKEAKQENLLFELDLRSIRKAVHTFFCEGAHKDSCLFVNIFSSSIIHSNFPSILQAIITEKNHYSQDENDSMKLVFELIKTEFICDSDFQILKERIGQIKDHGILIAINDVWKERNSLKLLFDVNPTFLKLDKYFAEALVQSEQKQLLIELLIQYCVQNNCKLILEGVERNVDLAVAKSIGVCFSQGYLLGKPEAYRITPEISQDMQKIDRLFDF
ncbi:MAG TPA: EAL domain-containing protein [Neobacillus sp.]|jgi:EAL domain-containing protein (putative c-di-GMP-specific phosphodiesterase class I)